MSVIIMEIKNAKYLKNEFDEIVSIAANIDGTDCEVPVNINNGHYAEMMKQVEEGKLTIKEAD